MSEQRERGFEDVNQMDRLLAGPIFNPDLTQPYYDHLRRYDNRELPMVGDIVSPVSGCEKDFEFTVERVEPGFRDFAGMTGIAVRYNRNGVDRLLFYKDPRAWRLVRRAEAKELNTVYEEFR